ncbi:hypothetical protein DFQ26_007480 [Actinomortierella ambigua]|nr:hypothetical protein DFQ26_007480 [Actinomortierella ambigua]
MNAQRKQQQQQPPPPLPQQQQQQKQQQQPKRLPQAAPPSHRPRHNQGTHAQPPPDPQPPSLQLQLQQPAMQERQRRIYQQQLLTEHFGYSPLSFVDDVINSINNLIYQASMALQAYAEQEMADIDPSLMECAKCIHRFETLLESAVDKNFDRFELYALKNIFGVPEDVDVVLPHYEALDFDIPDSKERELDDQLAMLRRQVIATKALNYKLRKELDMQNRKKRQLEKCRDQIMFLREAIKEFGDVQPLPQTLIFIRDNIETLHDRFQQLYTKLQQYQQQDQQLLSKSSSSASTTSSGTSSSSALASLRDHLARLQPDQRAIYIQSVVRKQTDELQRSRAQG